MQDKIKLYLAYNKLRSTILPPDPGSVYDVPIHSFLQVDTQLEK